MSLQKIVDCAPVLSESLHSKCDKNEKNEQVDMTCNTSVWHWAAVLIFVIRFSNHGSMFSVNVWFVFLIFGIAIFPKSLWLVYFIWLTSFVVYFRIVSSIETCYWMSETETLNNTCRSLSWILEVTWFQNVDVSLTRVFLKIWMTPFEWISNRSFCFDFS